MKNVTLIAALLFCVSTAFAQDYQGTRDHRARQVRQTHTSTYNHTTRREGPAVQHHHETVVQTHHVTNNAHHSRIVHHPVRRYHHRAHVRYHEHHD